MRQLRLLTVTLGVIAVGGAAVLASSASGSTFAGKNGRLVFAVHTGGVPTYLATAKADGTKQKRITTPPAKSQGDMQPRYSAKGTKIVFVRNPKQLGFDHSTIWIVNANGTKAKQLVVKGLPKGDFPAAPTFTRNGKTIVFELDAISGPLGIWKVSAAGGTASQITNGNDYQPTVSPDGTKVAFMRASTLMIANLNGSNPQTLYTELSGVTSIDNPDFSSDGSTIAFMAYSSSPQVWDILTVPAAGGVLTNLTNGTDVSSLNPAFSPDGKKIAFTAVNNATNATSIDVMPATGGAPTAIITPAKGFVDSADWGILPKRHHHSHH